MAEMRARETYHTEIDGQPVVVHRGDVASGEGHPLVAADPDRWEEVPGGARFSDENPSGAGADQATNAQRAGEGQEAAQLPDVADQEAAQAERRGGKPDADGAETFPPDTPAGEDADYPERIDAGGAEHFPGRGLGLGEERNPAAEADEPPEGTHPSAQFPAPGLGHGEKWNKGDATDAEGGSSAAPGSETAIKRLDAREPLETEDLYDIERQREEDQARRVSEQREGGPEPDAVAEAQREEERERMEGVQERAEGEDESSPSA